MAKLFEMPTQYIYDGMRLPRSNIHPKVLERIRYELTLGSQDVLSASYSKTGSTWVNQILFLIRWNADENVVKDIPRPEKYYFIELDPPGMPEGTNYQNAVKMASPKLIKTHLPVRYFTRNLCEDGPKIVVTMRNPKDTLVSTYHFYRMNKIVGNFAGSWDEYFELHRNDALFYEDMFKYNVGWYEYRNHPNVLIVKYEDIHADTEGKVREIIKFLGKDFTDEQIQTVIRLSSFDVMAENMAKSTNQSKVLDESISKFFRKGKIGDWKNYFNVEQNAFVENQCKEIYEPIGLKFDYE